MHVFDSGEEGKKGFARALPVHLTSPRPAKVVDVLAAVLPQLDLNFDATKALALWCTSPLLGNMSGVYCNANNYLRAMI